MVEGGFGGRVTSPATGRGALRLLPLLALGLWGCSSAPMPIGPYEAPLLVGERQLLREEGALRLWEGAWVEEGERGRWFLACVPVKSRVQVLPSDTVVRLDVLVSSLGGSWAAINGGFYDQAAMGLVVSGGRTLAPLTRNGGSGVLSWGPGPAQIQHRDRYGGGAQEALQSIDRLVDEGKVLVKTRADAHRDSRSGFSLSAEGMCLSVAAADSSLVATTSGYQLIRTAGEGLTLAGFARLLRELQAMYALNLDGAVSSQMIVKTATGRWEVRGERGTINAVVIHP